MEEADLRKKTDTNAFREFLSRVMPTGRASKGSPPPQPPPGPTPQKMRPGTQMAVTSASFTASPPPIKEFKYEPKKRVEDDDDDEDDYDEDDNFVEDEARGMVGKMSVL